MLADHGGDDRSVRARRRQDEQRSEPARVAQGRGGLSQWGGSR
jgi:hypothetical protein